MLHFARGNIDGGFKLLEKGYEDHDVFMCYLKIDALLSEIGFDPRYKTPLQKIGLDK